LLHKALEGLGVECLDDLNELEDEDLNDQHSSLKSVQRKQLRRLQAHAADKESGLQETGMTARKRSKSQAQLGPTGHTPSKTRARGSSLNQSLQFGGEEKSDEDAIQPRNLQQTMYRDIGPAGQEFLVHGNETMEEMYTNLPAPAPGTKAAPRSVRKPGSANMRDQNQSHSARDKFDKTKTGQSETRVCNLVEKFKKPPPPPPPQLHTDLRLKSLDVFNAPRTDFGTTGHHGTGHGTPRGRPRDTTGQGHGTPRDSRGTAKAGRAQANSRRSSWV
jgi:hypothetical protein